MLQSNLFFTNFTRSLTLASKCYELNNISIIKGGTIEGYKLNIISYITPVKSNIPIIFDMLENIEYTNVEKTAAKFLVYLNFTDKTNIQLLISPPSQVKNYQLVIGYCERQ